MRYSRRIRCACEHVYLTAVCLFLLWDVAFMTEAEWTFAIRPAFPWIWRVLAVCALGMSRGRIRAMAWPALLLVWMAGTSLYRGTEVFRAVLPAMDHGVLAFLVVGLTPFAVEERRLKAYLKGLLALWTALYTLQSLIGLWAALSGHAVFSLKGTWYIGVNLGDHRLYMMAYVTTGAVKTGMSVLLALLGAAMTRRWPGRIAYGVCMLIHLACLALTDCRTAFIALGAALGLAAAVLILRGRVRDRQTSRRVLRWGCAVLAVMVMTGGVYLALSGVLTALSPHVPQELENINILELPGELLPSAHAEEAAVRHRGLDQGDLFNGRSAIWRGALALLQAEPKFLVTGTTSALSGALTNAHIPADAGAQVTFKHVHNIYLQTLVNWGVPGLLLLAGLLAALARASWRLMLGRNIALWQRFVPLAAVYMLLCDLVDCHLLLSEGTPMLYFASLSAALALRMGGREESGMRLASDGQT